MKRALGALLALVALASPAVAHADDDPAAAQFELGLAAMKTEKWDTACPALAESHRLDPRAGVMFTLAECESKWGKLAASLNHYQAYLDAYAKMKPDEQSRQGRRAEIAQTQKQALERDVPRLTIKLGTGAAPGASIVLDGVALDRARVGTAIPLDPGEHTVVLNASDGTSEPRKVSLAVREQRLVELGGVASAAAPASPPAGDAAPPTESPRSKVPVIAAISVAVLGVGVGSATGLIAAGKKSTIDEHCVDTRCDATGKQAGDDAKSMATISTVAFGVGIAATAVAVVLIVTAPSSPAKPGAGAKKSWRPDVALGNGSTSLGLSGTF